MTGYNSAMHRKSRERHTYDRETRTKRKKDRIAAMIEAKAPKQLKQNIFSRIAKKASENRPVSKPIPGKKASRFASFLKKIKSFRPPGFKKGG